MPYSAQLVDTGLHGRNSVSLYNRGCLFTTVESQNHKRRQPRFYRETELGHCKLESTSVAEEGMQRKARKGKEKPR